MVVDGDGQNFLRTCLANDVLIKNFVDFDRLGQLVVPGVSGVLKLLANDVIAELDAFVTNKDRRARDCLSCPASPVSSSSSRMMSLQSSTHSSQTKTEGPAINLRTSCCDLPQKEQ